MGRRVKSTHKSDFRFSLALDGWLGAISSESQGKLNVTFRDHNDAWLEKIDCALWVGIFQLLGLVSAMFIRSNLAFKLGNNRYCGAVKYCLRCHLTQSI